uniref:Lysozyme g n=1 Tax=Oncorhynchus kisutch TaxID=8019 RepID=A0A8C7F050_ONCKI
MRGAIMKLGRELEPNKGMHASERMSDDDKNDVMKYKAIIKKVGGKYEIDPAIICGIISRVPRWESNTGQEWLGGPWNVLWVDVTTNGGNHTTKGEWGGQEHLKQGTQILINTKEQQLKGTFDTSWTNQMWPLMDGYTTQKDYPVMLPKLNTLHNGY